jgi:hypothetical protein
MIDASEIRAELRSVLARIDRAFAEDADRYESDRQMCLEEVQSTVSVLVERLDADLP